MNKKQSLSAIANEIEACTVCQEDSIGKAVPGEGNPDASMVLVGEAPGKLEAQTCKPFVGRSGQFLRKKMQGNPIRRSCGMKYAILLRCSEERDRAERAEKR